MPARKAAIAILLGAGRLGAADGMGDSRPPTRAPSINQICRRLTERMDFDEGPHTPRYRHRLLLMLDEFASLGRLDFFQTQLSYLPGYGIKAFLIVQDLSQLYGRLRARREHRLERGPVVAFYPIGDNSRAARKDERLDVRLNREAKLTIMRAAELRQQSVSDLILSAAQEGIERANVIRLNEHQSERFLAALAIPPAPSPKLREAAENYQQGLKAPAKGLLEVR